MAFTADEITQAKRFLLQNVLRVREGNTWVEYGSAAALRKSIADAEREMANSTRPRGTRLTHVSSGFNDDY